MLQCTDNHFHCIDHLFIHIHSFVGKVISLLFMLYAFLTSQRQSKTKAKVIMSCSFFRVGAAAGFSFVYPVPQLVHGYINQQSFVCSYILAQILNMFPFLKIAQRDHILDKEKDRICKIEYKEREREQQHMLERNRQKELDMKRYERGSQKLGVKSTF